MTDRFDATGDGYGTGSETGSGCGRGGFGLVFDLSYTHGESPVGEFGCIGESNGSGFSWSTTVSDIVTDPLLIEVAKL